MKALKALLLILGLSLSLGAYANGDVSSRLGEDKEGCGSADELKGCKCIKQSIAEEDSVPAQPAEQPKSNGSGPSSDQ